MILLPSIVGGLAGAGVGWAYYRFWQRLYEAPISGGLMSEVLLFTGGLLGWVVACGMIGR